MKQKKQAQKITLVSQLVEDKLGNGSTYLIGFTVSSSDGSFMNFSRQYDENNKADVLHELQGLREQYLSHLDSEKECYNKTNEEKQHD